MYSLLPRDKVCGLLLVTSLAAAAATAGTFPPLNSPATGVLHPGKIVWAELFTSDPAAASRFYSNVLGWSTRSIEQDGVAYTVFSNDGRPVAGLRIRGAASTRHAARWVDYVSVSDPALASDAVTAAGGTMRGSQKDFPYIGTEAIATDNEGSPIGLITSTSGDTPEEDARDGDWSWFHLLAANPEGAAGFYHRVFGYEVNPDGRPGKSAELILSTGDFNRAGISVLSDKGNSKPGWLGVVRVRDLDRTLETVTGNGGEIIVAAHGATLGSRFAVISDPTGGTIGLVEYANHSNADKQP